MNEQVEFVARAFFDVEADALTWEYAPEILKEEYRHYARDAIRLMAQTAQPVSSAETAELSFAA